MNNALKAADDSHYVTYEDSLAPGDFIGVRPNVIENPDQFGVEFVIYDTVNTTNAGFCVLGVEAARKLAEDILFAANLEEARQNIMIQIEAA